MPKNKQSVIASTIARAAQRLLRAGTAPAYELGYRDGYEQGLARGRTEVSAASGQGSTG